jgi:hypothetical protein
MINFEEHHLRSSSSRVENGGAAEAPPVSHASVTCDMPYQASAILQATGHVTGQAVQSGLGPADWTSILPAV